MAFACGLLLFVSLAACLGTTDAVNPGFVVRLTQKGLDYARQEGMKALQQELSKIHLPDFSGSTKIKHLGKVKYSFHSMVIRSFQLPTSQITLVPNVGLKLSISGAFIQVDGQWKVKFIHISDHGHFDLKVEGLSISVGLRLGSDGSGRPTITPTDCSCHISDVKVHVSGKFSWLVDIFHKSIDKALRKSIEDQLCPIVTKSITSKLQPLLQTLPVTAKIDKVAAIDYSLTGPPSVTAEYVDVQLKGEFFELSHRSTPPFTPPAVSFPVDHNLMVYFGVSDYLFNTAGFVYQSAGKLVFSVTDDMIPKNFSVHLNTSSFGTLIPQISKMYPNMLMKLKISTPAAPFLNINPGNLTISPVLDMQAYVILPNSSLASLFLLNLTTSVLVKVGVNSGRIVGNLVLSRVQMEVVHSDVGPFSVAILNIAVNYYISNILLPQVNEVLNKGYPLPLLDHVQLTDVVLKPYEHFLLFGANVHYG
ncbi:bactericidal permeability-increasing protein-like [Rhinophrynus dorsalis]